jgi:outer membrane protein OmpA-like peptidoglycan-associated protein
MHRRDFKICTWGVLIFLFITVICLNRHLEQIPLKLKSRCLNQIDKNGGRPLEIKAEGRNVMVRGTVPDEKSRIRLMSNLSKVPGIRILDMAFYIEADSIRQDAIRRLSKRYFYFSKNSQDRLASSEALLDSLAEVINTYPKIRLTLQGWADKEGDSTYNLYLSEKRAAGIWEALIIRECDSTRLSIIAYGETWPDSLAIPDSLKRRVDFIFEE